MGRVVGVFGVQGWVKIHSYTQPHTNLIRYRPWILVGGAESCPDRTLLDARVHGKQVIALFDGCLDPSSARPFVGNTIMVPRLALPSLETEEYYWADLVGLQVFTSHGVELGSVIQLFETGANDVLVVRGDRERLIPYLPGRVVQQVDLAANRLVIEWDPEF